MEVPWKMQFQSLVGERELEKAKAVSVDVDTGNFLHLVREQENEKPVLTLQNTALGGVTVKSGLRLTCNGEEERAIPFEVALSAGERKAIALPFVMRKGVWHVKGVLKADDGSEEKVDARYAVVDFHRATPKQPKGTFRLGVNYHMGRYSAEDKRRTIAALNACGAKLVRGDIGSTMSVIQGKGPDHWDFSVPDRNLALLEQAGLSVYSDVFFMPKWAARPECRTNKNWQVWALGRPMPGLLEKFCERLAARYGTRIDYYETGNEWDLGFTGTLDEALEVQEEVYKGLKRGCPGVCVIPNEWAAPGNVEQVVRSGRKDFHESFLRRGAQWFDVHPIHIHGGFAGYVRDIEDLFFPLRERTGVADKPWYSNETSTTSVWGEHQAAQVVWKKILYAWSKGSTDYIWYNLKGTGWDPKDAEQGFGMMTADYKPRESYVAFAALATTFGGKTFKRTVLAKASRYMMAFANDREIAFGAWDESLAAPVRIKVKTDARCAWRVDLMGNREAAEIKDGAAEILIGADPSALVLEGAAFAAPDMDALGDIPPPRVAAIEIPARNPVAFKRDRSKFKPDFVLDAHAQVTDFFAANPAEIGRLWTGPGDLSAKVWLFEEAEGLRLIVEVEDDVHSQPYANVEQWKGDDVQVALASHLQSGSWEINLARTNAGEPMVSCTIAPKGGKRRKAEESVVLKTMRQGTKTGYNAFFPYATLGFDRRLMKQGFRFNLLVNDNDGDGRNGFIEIKPNNFSSKNAGNYPVVRFR